MAPALTQVLAGQTFSRVDEEARGNGGTGLRVDPDKLQHLVEDLLLAGEMFGRSLNPAELTDPDVVADEGTRRCLETKNVVLAVGGLINGSHPCLVLPIYLPSRNDAAASDPAKKLDEATEHRADAIDDDLTKIVQTYRPGGEFPFPDQWYDGSYPCKGRPSGVACDEFPNKAMEGSGPPAQYDASGNLMSEKNTSLRTMSKTSNELEGSRYSSFTRACSATVKVARVPFLVIPMNDDAAPPASWAVCPEGSGPLQ